MKKGIAPVVGALAVALVALTACSGGGTTCTGEGCGLDEAGAPASSSGGSSASSGGGSSSGMASSSGGADGGTDDCVSDGKNCYCGAWASRPGQSGQKVASCSKASVGASWCCATNDFPSSGSCWCLTATPNCHRSVFGDVCICSHAAPDQGDKPVASCTAKPGGVCCAQPGNIAPICACYDTLTTCPSGGSPVPSCDTGKLQCEGRAVDVCR